MSESVSTELGSLGKVIAWYAADPKRGGKNRGTILGWLAKIEDEINNAIDAGE